jgi:hypothetical protein
MTVQHLYDLTRKAGHDPRKVELFLAESIPSEDAAAAASRAPARDRRAWRAAYLVTEGSIHL